MKTIWNIFTKILMESNKSINQLESLKNVFFRWEDQKLYKINAEWSHWPVSTLQLKINPASCHFLYR